jgi:cobalt-zinc-cadmium efflux system outer membrane protein
LHVLLKIIVMKLKLLIAILGTSGTLHAQTPAREIPKQEPHSLSQLFEAAWQRQAEFISLNAQKAALTAKQASAQRRVPEAGVIDASTARGNLGGRGYDISFSAALWQKNEQGLSLKAVAHDSELLSHKLKLAQLRTAAQVRDAYWHWLRTANDEAFLSETSSASLKLLDDVKKRFTAGDMSRADLQLAELAYAANQSAIEDAQLSEQTALTQLNGLTGLKTSLAFPDSLTTETASSTANNATIDVEEHPVLKELQARIDQLRTAQQLSIIQSNSRAELSVGLSRDRGATGDSHQTSVRIGYKLPLNSSQQQRVASTAAQAQIDELAALLLVERERLVNEYSVAVQKNKSLQRQLDIAQQRTALSNSLQTMIQKAFTLGEADLPTRLRTQIEASEAQRSLRKIKLDQAAAVSTMNQLLGLLPVQP